MINAHDVRLTNLTENFGGNSLILSTVCKKLCNRIVQYLVIFKDFNYKGFWISLWMENFHWIVAKLDVCTMRLIHFMKKSISTSYSICYDAKSAGTRADRLCVCMSHTYFKYMQTSTNTLTTSDTIPVLWNCRKNTPLLNKIQANLNLHLDSYSLFRNF